MIRRAIYVSAELNDHQLFADALSMLGWVMQPVSQLDHALNAIRRQPVDALILHAPIPGLPISQPLIDRIQRAAKAKIVVLGNDQLRDNRNQRVVPDPVTAADLASCLSSLFPGEADNFLGSLLRSPVIDEFTQDALAYLLNACRAVQLAPGDQLFAEGDEGGTMYFILTGEVALDLGGTPNPPLKAGSFFGEMSMLRGAPRSATARAGASTVLLEITEKAVEEADATFRAIFFELISRTLMERLDRSNDMVRNIEEAELVEVDAAEVAEPVISNTMVTAEVLDMEAFDGPVLAAEIIGDGEVSGPTES